MYRVISRLNLTKRYFRASLHLLSIALLLCMSSVSIGAGPFDCDNNNCDLLGDGPYEQLAVGSVVKVATDAEEEAVFHWAKKHGYWATLPDDASRFAKTIQMMSINIGTEEKQKIVTLLMGRDHYDPIKILAGDYVRYTPHELRGPAPTFDDPAESAYWNLYGCIAVLCRADDKKCPSRYVSGLFSKSDGRQLDSKNMSPLADGKRIDVGTYMPLQAKNSKEIQNK